MKSNATRAKHAILLVWIVAAVQFISAVSSYFQFVLLDNISNGVFVSEQEASANDLRQVIVAIIYSLLFITSAVFFIMWFRRAYANQEQKFGDMATTNGWAAGVWFVPILNLFRPYRMMSEIYENAIYHLEKRGVIDNKPSRMQLVGWWWGIWIGLNYLSRIFTTMTSQSSDLNSLKIGTVVDIVISILFVGLAYLTVKTIQNYNEMELLLEEEEGGTVAFANKDILDAGM